MFDVKKSCLSIEIHGCSCSKRFDETLLPDKKDFYSNINIAYITDADYKDAKKVWKNFEIKNLGEYHNLYVQSDSLLLADVFECFSTKVLKYISLIRLTFYWH